MPQCPKREECVNFTLDPYNGECMFNSCLERGETPYKRYRRFGRKPAPPEDTAATIRERQRFIVERRHIEARAAWAQLEASLRDELAEAKAEAGDLCFKWTQATQDLGAAKCVIRDLCEERDEAKAEIERLRGKCEWEQLCKGYSDLCTEAELVVKSIKADAEVGKMVREMRDGTYLVKQDGAYWSSWYPVNTRGWRATPTTDPATVLRLIQQKEVGDD